MRNKFFLIFCISLIVQLTFMFFVDIAVEQDAFMYYELGKSLALGQGFSVNGQPCPNFSLKPLYCLFLAGILKIFGENVFIIKVIQAILIALVCVFVFKTAGLVFDNKIGFWSAFVTAIYPPFWCVSSHLVSESLFIFLFVLSIYFLVKAELEDRTMPFVYSAIFLGLSTQTRSTSIFLPFFILFFGIFKAKTKLKFFKRFSLICLVVLALNIPWTVRNYLIFKVFNPISGVEVIWQATYVEGGANPDNPKLKQKQQELIDSVNNYEDYNKIAIEAARENLKKHFLGYLALFPVKFIRLWIGGYSNLFDIKLFYLDLLRSPYLLRQHIAIFLFKTLNIWLSSILLFFGLIGMSISYKTKMSMTIYILILIFIYFSLLHMVLFAEPRYGIPFLPYLIIFAIFAVIHFLTRKEKNVCY